MAASGFTTMVSANGSVSLPEGVRKRLHWEAGTRLAVEHTTDGVLLRPMKVVFAPARPEDVFGCLRYAGKPKPVEDMNGAGAIGPATSRGRWRRPAP